MASGVVMRDLLYVEWRDAHGGLSEWTDIPTTMLKNRERRCIVATVGWVISIDKQNLIICPHIVSSPGWEDSGCGDMTIPVGSIDKMILIPISPKDGTPRGSEFAWPAPEHTPVVDPSTSSNQGA